MISSGDPRDGERRRGKDQGPVPIRLQVVGQNRPALLPSTGLGKALKAYDEAKAKSKNSPKVFKFYLDARKALIEADEARQAAAKKCGTLFKKTKATLENSAAALKAEQKEVHDLIAPVVTEDVKEYKERLEETDKDLDAHIKHYSRLIEGIEKDDPASIKEAHGIVTTESSAPMPSLRPSMGSTCDEMLKLRSRLEHEFPNEYSELTKLGGRVKEVGPKLVEMNQLHGVMKEALKAREVPGV
jgi:hypothetical protein